ncbi:MAG: Glutamine amidotransferase class-I domain protein [Candidatus Giovannonibacteria bacterium GW2011_GWA2_53_7]|uniref:Glutamine amidotransferase class-I domain protein n=1 Tax=Candidatus Giovannonibacteria bacterium GW2011_GWA2_53_7 TaxID=1618650 RepID=A0A0G2A578_9BACT|nr:MAG: Glutamine amidotransferase class-I domain protein [Candidatus Giovannonibacteria bacterium GW2011_GWA2_53_7]
MKKPRILIPSATHSDQGPCVFMKLSYIRALEEAGALLIITGRPHETADFDALIELADGLLLAGGVDVEPHLYGKKECPHCGEIDTERDLLELELLKRAERKGIPIFGICRGIQTMNVHTGGTLFRDLSDEHPSDIVHDRHNNPSRGTIAHDVEITPGTRLSAITGLEKTGVNSLHHQGIDRLGEGLRVSATAPDGLIEGIERPELPFWIGVQWHPEELTADAAWKKLFSAFVDAAKNAGVRGEAEAITNSEYSSPMLSTEADRQKDAHLTK